MSEPKKAPRSSFSACGDNAPAASYSLVFIQVLYCESRTRLACSDMVSSWIRVQLRTSGVLARSGDLSILNFYPCRIYFGIPQQTENRSPVLAGEAAGCAVQS